MKNNILDSISEVNAPPVLLSEIKFSVRTTNIFALNNIDSVEKFLSLTTDDFNNLQNLGNTSIQEIKSIQRFLALNYDIDSLYGVSKEQVLSYTDTYFKDNGLSTRAVNILNNNNIYTAEQLALCFEDELKSFDKCKNTTLEEVIDFRKVTISKNDNIKLLVLRKVLYNIHEDNLWMCISDVFSNEVWSKCNSLGLYTFDNLKNADDECLQEVLVFFDGLCSKLSAYKKSLKMLLYDALITIIRKPKVGGEWNSEWERDFAILKKRSHGATLEDIGKEFSLTRERIRQLEKRASNTFFNKYSQDIKCYIKKIFNGKDYIHFYNLQNCLDDLSGIFVYFLTLTENLSLCFNKEYSIFMLNNNWIKIVEDWLDKQEDWCLKINFNDLICSCSSELSDLQISVDIADIKKIFLNFYKYDYRNIVSKRKLLSCDIVEFLMNKYYVNGLDVHNHASLLGFREYALQDFGISLPEDDHALASSIMRHCVLCDRGVWKCKSDKHNLPLKTINEINSYIDNYPVSVVPINNIYSVFKPILITEGIDNKYKFQGMLKYIVKEQFKVTKDYIYTDDSQTFVELIADFIRRSKVLVTKEVLEKEFPGFSIGTMQRVVNTSSIVNMNGYYASIDNFNFSNEDILSLKIELDNIVQDEKAHNAKNIYYRFRHKFNGLFNRIGINHYLQFYYIINKLFDNKFEFLRPFVAKKGVKIQDKETQFVEFIVQKVKMSIGELREEASHFGFWIDSIMDFVIRNNDELVFLDENTIGAINQINLNEDKLVKIDYILDKFMNCSDYRYLTEIIDYGELSDIIPFKNKWFLYSVISVYSTKYKIIRTNNVMARTDLILVSEGFDESIIENLSGQEFVALNLDDLLDVEDLE